MGTNWKRWRSFAKRVWRDVLEFGGFLLAFAIIVGVVGGVGYGISLIPFVHDNWGWFVVGGFLVAIVWWICLVAINTKRWLCDHWEAAGRVWRD